MLNNIPSLAARIALLVLLGGTGSAWAADADAPAGASTPQVNPQTSDQLHQVTLKGVFDFDDVAEILQGELTRRGWMTRDVQDIGIIVRDEGKLAQNRMITAMKSDYLAEHIHDNPYVSVVVPQQIFLFRNLQGVEPEPYRNKEGEIVVGFIDPATNAKIVGFEDEALLNDIRTEMSDVLTATADFFREGTPAE